MLNKEKKDIFLVDREVNVDIDENIKEIVNKEIEEVITAKAEELSKKYFRNISVNLVLELNN